jgi:hypothetical protein
LAEDKAFKIKKHNKIRAFLKKLFKELKNYFLLLDQKKVIKEKSRLQIILGLLFFGSPTQYNSSSCVLLKQYCLLMAPTANLKTFAYPKILLGRRKSGSFFKPFPRGN